MPISTTCLSRRRHWSSRESSATAALWKLAPSSTKVGRLPVMRPFSRCDVVVGGSARKPNKAHCEAFSCSKWCICLNWLYEDEDEVDEDGGGGGEGCRVIKSSRSASTTKKNTLLIFLRCAGVPLAAASLYFG